ncbi:MAG: zinc ribbon domain-containing protein [Thermoplasmata archaeon]
MNCPKCGTSLPDSAKFCYSCGMPIGSAAPPPTPPGSADPQDLKCPACGAPIHPVFGEMIITCDYCGGSVTLGSGGWKEINKHTMLIPKVTSSEQAHAIVRGSLDVGLMHRSAFEESKIDEEKLTFVPFWVLPVSASTNYVYSDVAVGVGASIGTMAGAAVLAGVLGGGRGGGFLPMPIMMRSPVNSSRQDTITGMYEFPVVAVKGMTQYQPKNYDFALKERTFFDRKQIPTGTPVLNGDLGEDAAQHSAKAYVTQLQSEAAHQKHRMVSKLSTDVQVTEGELLHVPIWYFLLERKGEKSIVLIDSHAGRVMPAVVA